MQWPNVKMTDWVSVRLADSYECYYGCQKENHDKASAKKVCKTVMLLINITKIQISVKIHSFFAQHSNPSELLRSKTTLKGHKFGSSGFSLCLYNLLLTFLLCFVNNILSPLRLLLGNLSKTQHQTIHNIKSKPLCQFIHFCRAHMHDQQTEKHIYKKRSAYNVTMDCIYALRCGLIIIFNIKTSLTMFIL